MYKCEVCGSISKPREPRNTFVTKKSKKTYKLLDKNGERIGSVMGWEIKKEINLCKVCYKKMMDVKI